DRLPRDTLADLPGDLLAPIRPLLQCRGRLQLALRAAPPRLAPGHDHEPTRLLDRLRQQLARLSRQREHLALRLPTTTTDRSRNRPQLAAHRPRPIPHPQALL